MNSVYSFLPEGADAQPEEGGMWKRPSSAWMTIYRLGQDRGEERWKGGVLPPVHLALWRFPYRWSWDTVTLDWSITPYFSRLDWLCTCTEIKCLNDGNRPEPERQPAPELCLCLYIH